MLAGPGASLRITRTRSTVFLAVVMFLWYFYSSFIAGQSRYGFDHLDAVAPLEAMGLFAAACLAAYLVRSVSARGSGDVRPVKYSSLILPALAAGVSSAVLFWSLRNGFINDDGLFNMVSLQAGMRIIHHDEMLASLIVSRLWQWGIAGIRPEDSISLFSALWGGVFVTVTVLLGGRTVGSRWPFFLAGCLSAGYIQMFAGDVEFYAMVAALVSVYLLLSLEHLRGNLTLVLPSMALSAAICSHLLAGWLLPSLLFLFIRAFRAGRRAETAVSSLTFMLTAAFLFVIVSAQGLPVHQVTGSHAMGTADRSTLEMLASPSVHYHAGVVNVLFLIFPFWAALPLILKKGWLREDPFNAVAVICTAMLVLLALVWKLGLGPYHDWNLVATAGVPASILLWTNALKGRISPGMKAALVLLMLVGAIHSWAWIAGNHSSFSMLERERLEEYHLPTGEPLRMFDPADSYEI